MPRRVVVMIDKLSHMNDVMFHVYRSSEPVVDDEDLLVMDVFDPMTIKDVFIEDNEQLVRDPYTPNVFYASRHFETSPLPIVQIGGSVIPQEMTVFYPEQKMIEINGFGIGIGDTRRAYMTYEYQSAPVKDDYETQSGVTYYGPPATGLRPPVNVEFTHRPGLKKYEIDYEVDLTPVKTYYRIRARDTDGNLSDYSKELSIEIIPSTAELFFRIQRSLEGNNWTDVQVTRDEFYLDDLYPLTPPSNVQGIIITPIELDKASITFDNPWFWYNTYPRQMYRYRIRSEDSENQASEWVYINSPTPTFLKPAEILIRRKVDNGQISTRTGTDAIDFIRITANDVNETEPTITLIDDRLSEGFVYAWTFFYDDEAGQTATPVYEISDHRMGGDVVVEPGETDVEP